MQARDLILDNLKRIVKNLAQDKNEVEVQVSISKEFENGDYYTSIALKLASLIKSKPLDIAYKIKDELEKDTVLASVISKIEVAPPGFVNFFLSEKTLREVMQNINEKTDKFGESEHLKNQKVMIEYTDPNPFKEFHIGHLYSNLVGESLSRLFESQGATVWRVCYQGDVGLHVAKAIYGMQKLLSQEPSSSAPLSVRAQFMGQAYALGSKDYEASKDIKREIDELNKKIYEKDSSILDLYKKGRDWSLEYFESMYQRLGTKFAHHYFESEVEKIGSALVREFLEKKIFEESEGAIIFPGKKYGLHTRVFINSLGIPTYEAKDLGLAPTKYKDFPYDLSIIITAQEQEGYFKVVLKALSEINPELALKTTHITHGMVRLPGGKMSSRTGDVITGEWLIDEAVARIRREYPEMDQETSEKVGLAAIKYALLKGTIGRDIEFSFEESISLTGASGPYLQYAFVRAQSILEKSKKAKNEDKKDFALNSEELAVLRRLSYFPEIVMEAQSRLSPNQISEYLYDLASEFNFFYQKHKVAGSAFRLELTMAVGHVLKNGLNLLGIESVKKM